jgi:hypothetical protein
MQLQGHRRVLVLHPDAAIRIFLPIMPASPSTRPPLNSTTPGILRAATRAMAAITLL